MAEQTNETNIFNQSFEDLIKSVGAKASNPTESSNVATPVAEAPKAKVEEKKAETAADKPATDTATAPSTDSYRVPVDVFGGQEAVDPVDEKATEEPAKAPVTEPVAAKEAEKSAEKPAAKNSRNRRSAKKTAEESKDVITVTVPLNAKVAALLDDDAIQNIQNTAEANIEASIKEAVKAAAEALINAL